jgi:hypothetical protein
MTNATIIFNERVALMNDGKIGTTGLQITVVGLDGEEIKMMEPEELHTFQIWKKMGFTVKKGEHAVSMVYIWKMKTGKRGSDDETSDTEEVTNEGFVKVKAYLFSASQVQKPDQKSKPDNPGEPALPAAPVKPEKPAEPEPIPPAVVSTKKEPFAIMLRLNNKKCQRMMNGYKVQRGTYTFYVAKSENGVSWYITEAKSGLSVGIDAPTRKECVEKLNKFDLSRLAKFDLDKIEKNRLQLPVA